MKYLIGSILFGVSGIVLGILSYLARDNPYVSSYPMEIAATIIYLISFVLLEYAVLRNAFGSVFTVWAGGIVIMLVIIGIIFWGESINTVGIVSTIIATSGLAGLSISERLY